MNDFNERIVNWLNDAVAYILTHKLRSVVIFLLVIIPLAIIYIVTNYQVVYITVTKPSGVNSVQLSGTKSYGAVPIGGEGLRFLPKDIKSIIAQSGDNIRTQSALSAPWYGFEIKNITLKVDKNADKIAYRSSLENACGVYSERLKRLAQYACSTSPSNTMTYFNTPSKGTWTIESISASLNKYRDTPPVPYMGGLLGISYIPGNQDKHQGRIVITTDSGKNIRYEQPSGISDDDIRKSRIFTDTINQKNNRFVVAANDGSLYLATPSPDNRSNSYKKIPPPEGYNPASQQTLCTIDNDDIFCIRSNKPLIHDDSDLTASPAEIMSLRFSSPAPVTAPIDNPSLTFLTDFTITKDNQLYGLDNGRLLLFAKKDDRYITTELAQNISSIAGGDTLYYILMNGVFAIDQATHESYQIFYSLNIKPSRIHIASNKVFILGRAANSNEHTYAWLLNNEDNQTAGRRLIDLLPSFPSSIAYGSTDLVGTHIYINTITDRTSTKASIQRQIKATLDYLKLSGVDVDRLSLSNP